MQLHDWIFLSPVSPQKIIDDVLSLARFSYLHYQNAFPVVFYLQNEIEYIPWKAAFKNLDFVLRRFKPNEAPVFKVNRLEHDIKQWNRQNSELLKVIFRRGRFSLDIWLKAIEHRL